MPLFPWRIFIIRIKLVIRIFYYEIKAPVLDLNYDISLWPILGVWVCRIKKIDQLSQGL